MHILSILGTGIMVCLVYCQRPNHHVDNDTFPPLVFTVQGLNYHIGTDASCWRQYKFYTWYFSLITKRCNTIYSHIKWIRRPGYIDTLSNEIHSHLCCYLPMSWCVLHFFVSELGRETTSFSSYYNKYSLSKVKIFYLGKL